MQPAFTHRLPVTDLTDTERSELPVGTVVERLPRRDFLQMAENHVLNVGRCDHTFLHHLVHHYDALPAVLVFVSGDGDDARKGPKIHRVLRWALDYRDTVLSGRRVADVHSMPRLVASGGCMAHQQLASVCMDHHLSMNEVNRVDEGASTVLQPAPTRPFGKWYAQQFPELENVPIRILCYTSIFAVHRRHVQQHPVHTLLQI